MVNCNNQLIIKAITQRERRTKLHETIQLHILHHWQGKSHDLWCLWL